MLALTWDCVDLDNDGVNVKKTLKSSRGQGTVVSEPQSEKSRHLVYFQGYTVRTQKYHAVIENMLKKAGLPDTIRIHARWHSFVSIMLFQTIPSKDV